MAEPDDQVESLQTVMINGVHAKLDAPTHKTIAPASSVYIFTKDYTTTRDKQVVRFKKGLSYTLDAALKSMLLAASAPMVAA